MSDAKRKSVENGAPGQRSIARYVASVALSPLALKLSLARPLTLLLAVVA
jgi:hypothetical protein